MANLAFVMFVPMSVSVTTTWSLWSVVVDDMSNMCASLLRLCMDCMACCMSYSLTGLRFPWTVLCMVSIVICVLGVSCV